MLIFFLVLDFSAIEHYLENSFLELSKTIGNMRFILEELP